MTCSTCTTDILHCTAITERLFSADGRVIACASYKRKRKTLQVSVLHAVLVVSGMVALVSGTGWLVGYEGAWKTAEEQQIRDREALLKAGLSNRISFYLPKSDYKMYPRADGKYNVSRGK